jgi:septum formation protein
MNAPLVLASQSASRQAMLGAAGIEFVARASSLDESAFKRRLAASPAPEIALALAEAKAAAVSEDMLGALVLGGDSLVEVEGQIFDKPRSREEAAEHLRKFSGHTMALHSAAALVRDGVTVWRHVETADLYVRVLPAQFIEDYLDFEWPAVAGCVGVFRIEARGVQLFDRIEGSHFTVLGMPLLAVLAALRDVGAME